MDPRKNNEDDDEVQTTSASHDTLDGRRKFGIPFLSFPFFFNYTELQYLLQPPTPLHAHPPQASFSFPISSTHTTKSSVSLPPSLSSFMIFISFLFSLIIFVSFFSLFLLHLVCVCFFSFFLQIAQDTQNDLTQSDNAVASRILKILTLLSLLFKGEGKKEGMKERRESTVMPMTRIRVREERAD